MNELGNLPIELLSEIVHRVNSRSDLFALSHVNRQLHGIVNPILWRAFYVKDEDLFAQVMVGLVESNPPVGQYVRHVHLEATITDVQLLAFMKHVTHLEDLMMSDAPHLSDTSIQQLPTYCPRLKRLELYHIGGVLTHQSILVLAHDCSRLSELALTSDFGLPCVTLVTLAACPLEKLEISLHDDVDDEVEDGTNNNNNNSKDDVETPLDDLASFKQLWSLKIVSGPSYFISRLITTLTHHPDWMPCLEDLLLDCCDTLTEHQIIAFMKTRPDMDTLTFVDNNLTDTFLDALPMVLPGIEKLDLSYSTSITADGVRRLILACPLLLHVDLWGSGLMAEDFPEAMTRCLDKLGGVDFLDYGAIEMIRMEKERDGDDNDDDDHDDDDIGYLGDDDEWEERLARWEFHDLMARGEVQSFSDSDDNESDEDFM